ncbi:MAG: acyl-CoA dehydrogenase family protein [Actinomycetota bacterium]|nr:acyl-CoA dehydrogenase family protein [Actinomycetota bacterium]
MLTSAEAARREEFRSFARAEIAPCAADFDRAGAVDDDLIAKLAGAGYLGAMKMDEVTYGLLCEEVGAACSSVRSLLTVQNMVARTIARWGSAAQKDEWLPLLASGEAIAAFCLTEPGTGSDAAGVETSFEDGGDFWAVTGHKLWVTFGQRADVFLVVGRAEGGTVAALVPRSAEGLSLRPVEGQLGLRAAMLAEVVMERCRVPKEATVGRVGFGFSHVASTTLDHGRYSVAWGCVGIARGCLDASAAYASERVQFGAPLRDHQLVRRMLTDMQVSTDAARLMCVEAGRLRDASDPRSIEATMAAKYFASTILPRVTNDAVQVHGANGVDPNYAVERHFRDAKIMQIIEGTDQMHQLNLADVALRGRGRGRPRPDALTEGPRP